MQEQQQYDADTDNWNYQQSFRDEYLFYLQKNRLYSYNKNIWNKCADEFRCFLISFINKYKIPLWSDFFLFYFMITFYDHTKRTYFKLDAKCNNKQMIKIMIDITGILIYYLNAMIVVYLLCRQLLH